MFLIIIALVILPISLTQLLLWRQARRQGPDQARGARLGLAIGVSGALVGTALGVAGALSGGGW